MAGSLLGAVSNWPQSGWSRPSKGGTLATDGHGPLCGFSGDSVSSCMAAKQHAGMM